MLRLRSQVEENLFEEMSFLRELEDAKELVKHLGKAEMDYVHGVLFEDENTCLSVYREWIGTEDALKMWANALESQWRN